MTTATATSTDPFKAKVSAYNTLQRETKKVLKTLIPALTKHLGEKIVNMDNSFTKAISSVVELRGHDHKQKPFGFSHFNWHVEESNGMSLWLKVRYSRPDGNGGAIYEERSIHIGKILWDTGGYIESITPLDQIISEYEFKTVTAAGIRNLQNKFQQALEKASAAKSKLPQTFVPQYYKV